MNLIGAMDRCVDAIVEAEKNLPRVGLIVLDDWCSPTGRIEREHLDAVFDLSTRLAKETALLLIAKAGTDVTGKQEMFHPRSKTDFEKAGFEIWGLTTGKQKTVQLIRNDVVDEGQIKDSGFIF